MKYINLILLLLAATAIHAQDHILRYEYENNDYQYSSGACYQILELDTISKTGRFYIDGCYSMVHYAEISIKIVQVNKDSLVFYPDDIAIISVEKATYGKGGLTGGGGGLGFLDSAPDPKRSNKDTYNFTIYFKKKGKRLETKGCTYIKGTGYETSSDFTSRVSYNLELLVGGIIWLPPYMKKVQKVEWGRFDSDYKERVRRFYEEKRAKHGDLVYPPVNGIIFSD